MKITHSTNLFFREGVHDKVYLAEIDAAAAVVRCNWGRRGATLQSKSFAFPSTAATWSFYEQKIDSKLSSGYKSLPLTNGKAGGSACVATEKQVARHGLRQPEPMNKLRPSRRFRALEGK